MHVQVSESNVYNYAPHFIEPGVRRMRSANILALVKETDRGDGIALYHTKLPFRRSIDQTKADTA